MGYLTPDSVPADTICRVLLIPNNAEFIANVTGVLETLTFPESWIPFGTLTPDQSASALVNMFDLFCFGGGACHMVGEILCYAVSVSPDPNWLACDGQSVLRSAYPDLFTVIGSLYGSVDGTHFNLPDLRGRTIISNGQGFGLTDRFPGDNGGEEDHTLVTTELASHSHTDTGHAHSDIPALPNATTIGPGAPQATAIPGIGSTGVGSANLTSTGSDTPHNNMQPWLCMAYFIVALP